MHIQVNGAAIYCYTGGKAFDAAKPTVVFIHGVLNDHSVWALQSRYMANHGWNVLAVDLPGHCRSGGDAPASASSLMRKCVVLAGWITRLRQWPGRSTASTFQPWLAM